jgi:protein involved in polysaccharide export with SLBB domain
LVENPGRKVLRREVMPLYAILAEALPRPEATGVSLVRNGSETNLSLANNQDMATLVMSGDAIKVSASAKQFVYLGGDVVSGGEKEFREGMTLTQAILTAGGAREAKCKVRIARRGANGFLANQEYSLPAIVEGKAADPLLQAGDRIEVQRGVW